MDGAPHCFVPRLLLPLWFLLSFLIVVLLLQLLSRNPVVSGAYMSTHVSLNWWFLPAFICDLFSLLSSRFSRCH